MSEQSDVTRRWELASADTRRWRADADGLKAAADILRSHWLDAPGGQARIALPALLLAGYAVETFAKARILDLGNRPAFWTGHGHDLPWLVAQAGVEADEREAALLQRLKRVVEWAGRYPASRQSKDFNPEGEPWARQVHEGDFHRVDSLCARLADIAS